MVSPTDKNFPSASAAYAQSFGIAREQLLKQLQEEKCNRDSKESMNAATHYMSQRYAVAECKQAVFSSIAHGKYLAQCGNVRLDETHAKIFESYGYKVDNHAKRYAGFREFSGENIIDWSKVDSNK